MNVSGPVTQAPTIAIIGSGFGGLGLGYYLKQAGIDSFTIFEKATDLGGVWRENTYPGAACDIPSHLYSFSFEPHYPWSYRYGHQHEILDYQHHVARKHDLNRHIRFNHEMKEADFDETRGIWTLHFADGSCFEANVLISAVGQLHRPQLPNIKGLERFKGPAFHSARWDHRFNYQDKTVAVIGTGASAVQFVPRLAEQVKQLHVFQRSPAWCIPKFDRKYYRWERWLLTHVPFLHDFDRIRIFWYVELVASVIQKGSILNRVTQLLARGVSSLLMRLQVRDPVLRKKLTPNFPIGCKRLLLSNEWLKTLAKANVEVVTEGITEITESGIVTSDGRERKVDAIVYGTGFAATEFLAPMTLRGLGGTPLRERWKEGAEAYFGVTVSDFPNFFMLYGPNTNLGVGTIIFMLERQQRYIVRCIQQIRQRGLRYMDISAQAEREYNEELTRRNKDLVYIGGCNSWYITNGHNTNNWVGYMTEYGRRMRKPVMEHYRLMKSDASN